jgi:hypothetical protein
MFWQKKLAKRWKWRQSCRAVYPYILMAQMGAHLEQGERLFAEIGENFSKK